MEAIVVVRPLSDKKKIVTVLIDLSKAFRQPMPFNPTLWFVNYRIWLPPTKLVYGSKIERYLTNRQLFTRVATSLSEPLTITHGVPQGSILGPTFFSLFMNDLPEVIKFSNIESYIDGTKIYFSFASKDTDSCLRQVAKDLQHVVEWCRANYLLINPDKTKLSCLG